MSISIVIPAYNESAKIAETLRTIIFYLENKKYDYEIIVIDDGSTDQTLTIANDFASPKIKILNNQENRGKGFSVKRGMLIAEKDWILFTDADLSTPMMEIEKMLESQGADIQIGSRAMRGSQIEVHQPFYREWGGRFINFLVRMLVIPDIMDTQCGFKLFKKEAAKKIFPLQTINGFGFDIETLYLARLLGYKIVETPVVWSHHADSKVAPFSEGFQILWDICKIRLRHRHHDRK